MLLCSSTIIWNNPFPIDRLGFSSTNVGQPLEDIAEEDEQLEEEEDADIGEEDEMADFIVDEELVDEHGAPVKYVSTPYTSIYDLRVFAFVCKFILAYLYAGGRNQRRAGSDKEFLHQHSRKHTTFLVMLKTS